jgi:hypothetical protein
MAAMRIRLANLLVRLGNSAESRRFAAAMQDPAGTQLRQWQNLLTTNAQSRYGQQHGFADIRSIADYQRRVPIVDYDGLLPHIEALKAGETGVLTRDSVLMFEKSSGSTAASKYVPYTNALRREFQAATSVWLHDLLTNRPKLRSGGSYWSVSPMVQEPEITAGGLKVGFEDDTEYFGTVERWVLGQLMMVPGLIRQAPGLTNNRYITLRYLLDRDDLALISVWNPSFLTLLVREVTKQGDRLVRDLLAGTLTPPEVMPEALRSRLAVPLRARPVLADRLDVLLRQGDTVRGTDLWPNLQVISCWNSGIAARFLPEMAALFPGIEIQGKGLLATEGVVTFPLLDHPGGVLALRSHFYEFQPLDRDDAPPVLAHQLDVGARYTVLMSTGGGFYRYALHDVVEVVGKLGDVPLLAFAGKAGKVCDVVGEKLNEWHVGEVLASATADLSPGFLMLAPEWGDPPAYHLFLQATGLDGDTMARLVATIETRLRQNHHYAYARDLGQLGPIVPVTVGNDAEAIYLTACTAMGQRAGDIKPTYLHKAFGWKARFQTAPAVAQALPPSER